jgi:hypothetical protein
MTYFPPPEWLKGKQVKIDWSGDWCLLPPLIAVFREGQGTIIISQDGSGCFIPGEHYSWFSYVVLPRDEYTRRIEPR